MPVHQAYRFALDPTAAQRRALASHCGAARFAFNWALRDVCSTLAAREWERRLLGGALTPAESWSLPALRRRWNQAKDGVAPWWAANSKEAYSSGLAALAAALLAWSDSRHGDRAGPPVGFPRFRKRSHRDSCAFTTGPIRVDGERHVVLPRIGRLRTCEAPTTLGARVTGGRARILRATVSREADRWFVSFSCEVTRAVVAGNGHSDTVGVDVGVHTLAALSTGELVAGPRALRASLRRLRRAQRTVARRRRGSARRRRALHRVARIHRRVGAVRRHHLHVLTTRLAKNHGRIVIEDLNVRGMAGSARGTMADPGRHVRQKAGQNRAVLDAGFAELRRMLTYKCAWYGAELVVADRFFPSSKRCSACGVVRAELERRERTFSCAGCGLRLDRDHNAARNLVWWAEDNAHHVAASAAETPNARGGAPAIRQRAGERSGEASTGIAPEPAGITTGGRHQPGLPCVPC